MANFFLLNRRLILVDLPGYGFNVARKEIRDLWDELLAVYTERTSIRKFLFLMDCRRDFEDFELEFIENLGRNAPVAIVLTKLDKLKKSEIKPRIAEISGQLRGGSAQCTVFPISSMKKQGIAELREHIFQFMAPTPS
jgi:GTP-binding protein